MEEAIEKIGDDVTDIEQITLGHGEDHRVNTPNEIKQIRRLKHGQGDRVDTPVENKQLPAATDDEDDRVDTTESENITKLIDEEKDRVVKDKPAENDQLTALKDGEVDTPVENERLKALKCGQNDRKDAFSENPLDFTYLDILFAIGAILVFYFDLINYHVYMVTVFQINNWVHVNMVTDALLMASYFIEGHYVYFALTMMFVIVPSALISIFSMIWYCSDDAIEAVSTIPPIIWKLRIIFHLLLMAPVWRAIETLHFGFKSWKSSNPVRYYTYRADFNKTTSLLKVLEAFVESAPQLVLQLFILLTKTHAVREENGADQALNVTSTNDTVTLPVSEDFIQVLSGKIQPVAVFSTFLSLSLSQTIFARNSRTESDMGSFAFFSWRFYTVGARVLALALFASVFPNLWFLLVVAFHWSVMSAWFIGLGLWRSGCLKLTFYLVFSLVYLFTYIKLSDDHSGRKYLFYYTFEVIEDAILVIVWACLRHPTDTYLYWTLLFLHFASVVMGLTSMLIYYAVFHPGGPKHNVCTKCLALDFPSLYQVPKQNVESRVGEIEIEIQ